MRRSKNGYFECCAEGVGVGAEYRFLLDGKKVVADPASTSQPAGVFGPSEVVDHAAFDWGSEDSDDSDHPRDRFYDPIRDFTEAVIYEIHVGTFTPAGTFDAAAERLHLLQGMGINCLQLLPVSPFSGRRNWGFHGVFPWAVHAGYGGPEGLKRFVRTAHTLNMDVVVDLAFGRLGSEGGVFSDVARYLQRDQRVPGERVINCDGPHSPMVREFFTQCVLHWLDAYRLDGVRLMGTEMLHDRSGVHFLEELSGAVREYEKEVGRRVLLVSGNDYGNTRVVMPPAQGGYGFDAHVNCDFQYALHRVVTGETNGPYGDFSGVDDLASILNHGVRFEGQISSRLNRRQGRNARDLEGERLIASIQNHAALGERAGGERISTLVSLEAEKTAAGFLLLSPFIPLVFMGQEYGETAPFRYFSDFTSPDIVRAEEKERARQLRPCKWPGDPLPPGDESAFSDSIPDWEQRFSDRGRLMVAFYTELLRLRKDIPGLSIPDLSRCEARTAGRDVLLMLRHSPTASSKSAAVFNFGTSAARINLSGFLPNGEWEPVFDSADEKWGGSEPERTETILCGECLRLSPKSFCLYVCRGFN